MTFLQIQDVMKLYKIENSDLQIPALRGVDLKFDKPELVSIIGPSGSGKSTLMKLLAGLDNPSSGIIEMENIGIVNALKGKKLLKYRQESIGMMYQFPEKNLLQQLSAINNVMFPMRILGKLSRSEMIKRATELLEAVDLGKRKNHKFHMLSGGEAQRVAIAICLANNPKLILADEPTGELDSDNTYKIIEYFKEIHSQFGTGFMVVTHDERFSNMTKNTYKIQDGRIVGLHRARKDLNNNIEVREHVNLIDKTGHVKIPDKILKNLNLNSNEVTIRVNKETGAIEIIPIKKQEEQGENN